MSVEKEGHGPTRYPESDLSIATAGLGALLVEDITGFEPIFEWGRTQQTRLCINKDPIGDPRCASSEMRSSDHA